jgi:hydroxyacylglutathione hydrolase
MEQAARTLYASLQKFATYPDWMQIWPGHGAGSACGKGLSAVPHSTVGYERRFNWAFGVADEAEFVQMVLAGQPEPPKYFAEMKRVNKEGPRLSHGVPRPERLQLTRLRELIDAKAIVVDTRHPSDFASGHVPGTLNIALNRSFSTWAGWLLPYDRDLYLIVDDEGVHPIEEAVRDLAMIGLDRVAGYFASAVIAEWSSGDRALESVAQIDAPALARRLAAGEVSVIDVRGRAEWQEGHVPGVKNIPVGYLADRLREIPRDKPVVVHCQSGARSAIAASILQANGVADVINLAGGFASWQKTGQAVERERDDAERITAA